MQFFWTKARRDTTYHCIYSVHSFFDDGQIYLINKFLARAQICSIKKNLWSCNIQKIFWTCFQRSYARLMLRFHALIWSVHAKWMFNYITPRCKRPEAVYSIRIDSRRGYTSIPIDVYEVECHPPPKNGGGRRNCKWDNFLLSHLQGGGLMESDSMLVRAGEHGLPTRSPSLEPNYANSFTILYSGKARADSR